MVALVALGLLADDSLGPAGQEDKDLLEAAIRRRRAAPGDPSGAPLKPPAIVAHGAIRLAHAALAQ